MADTLKSIAEEQRTQRSLIAALTASNKELKNALIRANQRVDEAVAAASLGTFVQEGSGAVIRTLQDKAREGLSLRDFLPTGAPDDWRSAYVAAHAELAAGAGGCIKITRDIDRYEIDNTGLDPLDWDDSVLIAGDGFRASTLANVSTDGTALFRPIGGAFRFGLSIMNLKLESDEQAGHIFDPEDDIGIANGFWFGVYAHVRNPLKSIWHQAIVQRGTFFFAFEKCRLECGTSTTRSRVPAIDIDGVDNSFSSVWFHNVRFQCNHSHVPFMRATNSAGGNPLKQVTFDACAVEQSQNGLLQVQGTVGLTINKLTFFDSVSPIRNHFLGFETGGGGLGNDFPSVEAYYRTGATLGAVGDSILDLASLTQAGGVATGTTEDPHGWVTGDQVEIIDAVPAGYEGLQTITVTGASTFTYPCSAGLASPATVQTTGVPIAARRVQRAVDTMTQAAGIATCNLKQAHSAEVGQRFFVDGADQAGYNGMQTVLSVVDSDTVTFAVDSGTVSPATGTIWAGVGAQDARFGPDDTRVCLKNCAGGSQDAEFDMNDAPCEINGKNPELKLHRVPVNTSSVVGMGSGASVETKNLIADTLAARTAGGSISVTSLIEATLGVSFNGNADLTDMKVATPTLDFPSLALGASAELTVTVSGIGTTWRSVVAPQTTIEAGLMWNWWISAADTVRIRVTNVNGANPLDPASRTWLVTCWKH